MTSALNDIIVSFEKLTLEDKEYVKGLMDKALIEAHREKIYQNALISHREVSEGKATSGTASEIIKSLSVS